jgi:hypothetical protein
MSCALTQGYTLDCADGIGGIKEIRVIESGYLPASAFTTGTSGVITAIVPTSSKKFTFSSFRIKTRITRNKRVRKAGRTVRFTTNRKYNSLFVRCSRRSVMS